MPEDRIVYGTGGPSGGRKPLIVIPTDLPLPEFADIWTPVTRARAAGLVARIAGAARRVGAPAMLEAGSLLGYARHGGRIIPWDDDVDLLVEDAAFARVMDVLADDRDLRVAIVDQVMCGEYGNVSWRSDPIGLDVGFPRAWGWPFVDVFRFSRTDAHVVLYPGGRSQRALDAVDVLPPSAGSFEGVPVHVPRSPDRVLDTLFPNWRIEFDTGDWDHRREAPRERTVFRWNPTGQPSVAGGRVVYTDMCADLFHAGHVNFLRQARDLGDRLVVGIHSDATIASYKGAPVMTMEERVAVVAACRHVDQVVPDAPLRVSPRYLDALGIHVVCHADELEPAARDRMYGEILATHGLELIPYTRGISTRELRARVLARAREASQSGDPPTSAGESSQ